MNVGDLPSLLEPATCWCSTTPRSFRHSSRAAACAARRWRMSTRRCTCAPHPDRWLAFMRPGKRVAVGDRIQFGHSAEACTLGPARRHRGGKRRGRRRHCSPSTCQGRPRRGAARRRPHSAAALHRLEARRRRTRPQARLPDIYAREEGAVAAPTAGLHFTPELFAALEARASRSQFVTLHVGAGTFLPVKADDTAEHKMHAERGHVSDADRATR
jgi:S-adenosylmethionine:tRNA ribosyltransferase-isomerase